MDSLTFNKLTGVLQGIVQEDIIFKVGFVSTLGKIFSIDISVSINVGIGLAIVGSTFRVI